MDANASNAEWNKRSNVGSNAKQADEGRGGSRGPLRQIVILLASIQRTAQSRACAMAAASSEKRSSEGKNRLATSSPSLDRDTTTYACQLPSPARAGEQFNK
jgi:hypothetical protein